MGSLINLIKKLFSGIFSFIGGIFGGNKSSDGYFLELDEAKGATPPPQPAKAETTTVDAAANNGSKPIVSANPLNLPQPTVSLASENLSPKPNNSRRRPGANMSSFLSMAKEMKTSNN